ncbi:glycosyltransferase family 4 protein [Leptolyngbya sp. DQ-M1]|uniref:glycosyltransferase family 4 protein n=1 Tax=Leptolyngbya sp. DQ-M1 TaxID=2933920 RepID=UPI0032983F72
MTASSPTQNSPTQNSLTQPTIALLPWGDLIEDFLDSIGVSLDSFCTQMTGGWLFGYVEALKRVGVRTVVFCISNQVTQPERRIHQPTGATLCFLPASKLHSVARRPMRHPYGWTIEETFGKQPQSRRPALKLLKDIAPYLATPLLSLAEELRREQCQAILCQEYEYARFDLSVLLGQWLRLPVFATFQGGDFQLSRLERFVRPSSLHHSAGLIVATQTEIQRLQQRYRMPGAKIAQIFNPMDVQEWRSRDRHSCRAALGLPIEADVVISHGRIDLHRKGLDILIAAWEQLCQKYPHRDLRLVLVGTGSDAQALSDLIAAKQLRGVLWINEYVRDRGLIQQYLSAADLYTLASRHEGFPVAPIEAMALGLPIVATDAPGIPDILIEQENSGGLIVPREDASALMQGLDRVLNEPELRTQLGARSRQRAEQAFSLEAIGQQLKQVLFPHRLLDQTDESYEGSRRLGE